jgi:fructose-1,6-bisphosphatase/inositol monophosphatase family enzyme
MNGCWASCTMSFMGWCTRAWWAPGPGATRRRARVRGGTQRQGYPRHRISDRAQLPYTASLLGFVQSVQTYKKGRILGSAGLMLAHVAAGRFDAYKEEDIYLWDVVAGLALVRAAGRTTRMAPGSDPFQYRVRADNGGL